MYNKFKDYSHSKWLLMKRYPGNIDICPFCEKITFYKAYNSKAYECINEKGETNQVWLDIKYTPEFHCTRCDGTMSKGKASWYFNKVYIFVTKYFKQKEENISYEDFLLKVSEFCLYIQRKLMITVEIISDDDKKS